MIISNTELAKIAVKELEAVEFEKVLNFIDISRDMEQEKEDITVSELGDIINNIKQRFE